LSSAVAGGLAFATILTLLLTPSLLMIQANVSERFHQRRNIFKKAASVRA
jgi:multidrug efflux pump